MKAKKGVLFAVLTVLLLGAVLSGCRAKDSPVPELKGRGTESKPYLISSADDLVYFADAVNGGKSLKGLYFALDKDIDLKGGEWKPIGRLDSVWDFFMSLESDGLEDSDSGAFFGGIFDGRGHKVSNFKITEPNWFTGFFGWNKGVVMNLTVSDFALDVTVPPS